MWNIDPRPRNFRCYVFQHFSKWRALFENVLVQLCVASWRRCSKVKPLHHVVIWSPRGKKKSLLDLIDFLCFSKKCTPSNVWCFLYCLYIIIPLPKKTYPFLCFLNLSKSNLKAKCFSCSSKLSAEENNFLFSTSFHFLVGSNQHPTY